MAHESVWCPGLSKQIETMIENCSVCLQERKNHNEILINSTLPDRPWQNVATDLFEFQNATYLAVIDYFSRYIEVAKLGKSDSAHIIERLKSIFARWGSPETVTSDNGPCYSSASFAKFADEYGFTHITSSPRYPQSNGEAERAVQTLKNLLKKSADPYLALMAYRSTPLQNGYSPSQLLMGRKIRSTVPCLPAELEPKWPDFTKLREKEEDMRMKQKVVYDTRHRTKSLHKLNPGDSVWIKDLNRSGTVISEADIPRSYFISTPNGNIRRNRVYLNKIPGGESENDASPTKFDGIDIPDDDSQAGMGTQTEPNPGVTLKPLGCTINPSERLIETW